MTVVIFHCFHFGGVKSYVKSVQKFKNSKKKNTKVRVEPRTDLHDFSMQQNSHTRLANSPS